MSVIVFGYYGFNNAGDELLLDETIKLLKELSLPMPHVVANGPTPAPFPTFNRWNLVAWLKQLRSADALIFGGGSIFQSVTSAWSLFYYLAIVCLAKLFQCRVILLCHGWGPFRQGWHERLAIFVLQSTHRSWRLQLDHPLFLDDPVFCDLTLTLPVKNRTYGDGTVGICVRPTIDFEKLSDVVQSQYASIETLSCQSDGHDGHALLDIWESHDLGLSLVITDRYHVAIWACRHGIAWVAISSDPKLVDLANLVHQCCYSSLEALMLDDRWKMAKNDQLFDWANLCCAVRPNIRSWLNACIVH